MITMEWIEGKGVSHVPGFRAASVAAGMQKGGRDDMALVVSDVPAVSASVFTQNEVKAAPVLLDREHAKHPTARAWLTNSGNANACTGEQGLADALAEAQRVAAALDLDPREVHVYSTGVIGVPLPMEAVNDGIDRLVKKLAAETDDGVPGAILTTDTREKMRFGRLQLDGVPVTLCGVAKGSGMIHPNMATMLSYIYTDCNISKSMLEKLYRDVADRTFNQITVDGDTSTNDTATIAANGLAGNPRIESEGPAYEAFRTAVYLLSEWLAKEIARDGEGASKLFEVQIIGAPDQDVARICAKSVAASSLVKSAIYGADANWGRILCAMGYAGAPFDPLAVDVSFQSGAGTVAVFRNGSPIPFCEENAHDVLAESEIRILIDMHQGNGTALAWGCDLTEEYIRINAHYRS